MKIFVAYKFSGEDEKELKLLLKELASGIEIAGHETFIHLRDAENWGEKKLSLKEVINGALEEIKNCDALLALVINSGKSEGMLLEVGFAKALGKKIIIAVKKGIQVVFLKEIADSVIDFSSTKDLVKKIKIIKS